jgi:hypothetical protein
MKFTYSHILKTFLKFNPILDKTSGELFLTITDYKVFAPNEYILKKGRYDRNLFFILKGSVRSFSIIDGVERNCHLRSEGYIMGDAKSFAENPVANLDTMAITECHVLLFDLNRLEELAFKHHNILSFYLKILKEIITVFSHRINTFVCMNSQQRYLDLINWNPGYLETTYDKHLASFLGITPLTFHRIKNKE